MCASCAIGSSRCVMMCVHFACGIWGLLLQAAHVARWKARQSFRTFGPLGFSFPPTFKGFHHDPSERPTQASIASRWANKQIQMMPELLQIFCECAVLYSNVIRIGQMERGWASSWKQVRRFLENACSCRFGAAVPLPHPRLERAVSHSFILQLTCYRTIWTF